MERIKKKLFKLFKQEGLNITAEGGSKVVDYLDIVLDLSEGSYCPYVKPNASTVYVSTLSNHPKAVLSTISKGVAKRLSNNSSSAEKFKNNIDHFKEALRSAGHDPEITYEEETQKKKRSRKKNIIYFNPPWSMNVRTNVGGKFLSLIRKHFPPGSPLHKVFNLSNLKVSYSTLPNMGQHIKSHNRKVIKEFEGDIEPSSYGCNCKGGIGECPLSGNCLIPSLVYKAEIEAENNTKVYFGQTNITFKKRHYLHKSDTKCGRRRTKFNDYEIDLKQRGVVPNVKWSIVVPAKPRKRGQRFCQLCVSEKTFIATGGPDMLNKRSEIMTRCRHFEELVLTNDLQLHTTARTGSGRGDIVSPDDDPPD